MGRTLTLLHVHERITEKLQDALSLSSRKKHIFSVGFRSMPDYIK
jgi:hypothetical protein